MFHLLNMLLGKKKQQYILQYKNVFVYLSIINIFIILTMSSFFITFLKDIFVNTKIYINTISLWDVTYFLSILSKDQYFREISTVRLFITCRLRQSWQWLAAFNSAFSCFADVAGNSQPVGARRCWISFAQNNRGDVRNVCS